MTIAAWVQVRRRLAASVKGRELHPTSLRVLEHELRVAEMMARVAPIREVLAAPTHSIEELAPECACAILRMTGEAARSASSIGSSLSGRGSLLKAVEAAEYDLVLMECQMPELDEYLATRAIRNLD
ncbi:MAG: hypothetical protein ABJA98_24555 [Acidobacteriota bacterium]